jgi:nucleoside-diphosphate-sugar epimerase
MAFSCFGNTAARGEIFHAAGPEVVESRDYYRIIGEVLGVQVTFEEIPVSEYLREEPTMGSFCCHRIYPMDKARSASLTIPKTSLREGLRMHVESLIS